MILGSKESGSGNAFIYQRGKLWRLWYRKRFSNAVLVEKFTLFYHDYFQGHQLSGTCKGNNIIRVDDDDDGIFVAFSKGNGALVSL